MPLVLRQNALALATYLDSLPYKGVKKEGEWLKVAVILSGMAKASGIPADRTRVESLEVVDKNTSFKYLYRIDYIRFSQERNVQARCNIDERASGDWGLSLRLSPDRDSSGDFAEYMKKVLGIDKGKVEI